MKILAFPLPQVKSIITENDDSRTMKPKRSANFPAAFTFHHSLFPLMLYVLIGLSLSLLCVAGLQFFYLMYLERIDRERKIRIHQLENHSKYLTKRLKEVEQQLAEQAEMLDAFYEESEDEEEVWADVIEDR
jgi:Tfp pilus assembly protein PilN